MQRVLEACHLYVGALPGIIDGAGAGGDHGAGGPAALPDGVTLIFAYALIFLPRALTGLSLVDRAGADRARAGRHEPRAATGNLR
jgi:hypothetical protein